MRTYSWRLSGTWQHRHPLSWGFLGPQVSSMPPGHQVFLTCGCRYREPGGSALSPSNTQTGTCAWVPQPAWAIWRNTTHDCTPVCKSETVSSTRPTAGASPPAFHAAFVCSCACGRP